MNLTGEATIAAPRERVYEALNDPEILQRSIPGCEVIEKLSDTEMSAKVVAKVGPIKAKFDGHVVLSDLQPPESYTISGQGKGGSAGFAKGSAKVRLETNGTGTVMRYEVQADVGGKLAQLGGRLIDGTAKKLAEQFFTNFAEIVGEAPPDGASEAVAPGPAGPAKAEKRANWFVWAAGAVIAVAILALLIVQS